MAPSRVTIDRDPRLVPAGTQGDRERGHQRRPSVPRRPGVRVAEGPGHAMPKRDSLEPWHSPSPGLPRLSTLQTPGRGCEPRPPLPTASSRALRVSLHRTLAGGEPGQEPFSLPARGSSIMASNNPQPTHPPFLLNGDRAAPRNEPNNRRRSPPAPRRGRDALGEAPPPPPSPTGGGTHGGRIGAGAGPGTEGRGRGTATVAPAARPPRRMSARSGPLARRRGRRRRASERRGRELGRPRRASARLRGALRRPFPAPRGSASPEERPRGAPAARPWPSAAPSPRRSAGSGRPTSGSGTGLRPHGRRRG